VELRGGAVHEFGMLPREELEPLKEFLARRKFGAASKAPAEAGDAAKKKSKGAPTARKPTPCVGTIDTFAFMAMGKDRLLRPAPASRGGR
jgi:hypothetical protein